jgi:hypothetical protein
MVQLQAGCYRIQIQNRLLFAPRSQNDPYVNEASKQFESEFLLRNLILPEVIFNASTLKRPLGEIFKDPE